MNKSILMGNAVVWTKANPTPWNTIKQDEGTKLIEVNQKFDKRSVGHTVPNIGSRSHVGFPLNQLDSRQALSRLATPFSSLPHCFFVYKPLEKCNSILHILKRDNRAPAPPGLRV